MTDPETGHRVVLRWRDGRRETVRATGGQTVFEAAAEAGVGVPVGCRTGACGTCTGRLLGGRVWHRRPPRALKRRHLDDGYVLTCVAVPSTDCELEVGSDVQADLLVNPWR